MKRILFLIILMVVCVPVGYYILNQKPKDILPVINPTDVQEEMVDPEMLRIGQGHRIGEFGFENQYGEWVSEKNMDGKISVVEYFFTTCKSICPIMNKQMQRVQNKFRYDKQVRIFSFTVDPDTDTVEQMYQYARKHGAKKGQWFFLTGKKEDLYSLARKSFFVLKPAEAQNLGDAGGDFIHTNNFVLVDSKRRIRGYYDGTNSKEVDQLMDDIKKLKKEPYKR